MILSIVKDGAIDLMHPAQGMNDLKSCGLTDLVVSYDFADIHDMASHCELPEYYEKKRRIWENAIISTLPQNGFRSVMLMTQRLDHKTKDALENRLYEEEVKKAIDVSVRAGISKVLVYPLFAGIDDRSIWKENRSFYQRIARLCEEKEKEYHLSSEKRLQIILINWYKYLNGHFVRGIFSDEKKSAELIDDLNSLCGFERFGFCLDSGNASLCGKDMHGMAVALGRRLKVVLLSDNDGHNLVRCLPFTCGNNTDWLSLIRGMRDIDFDGIIALDASDTIGEVPLFYRNSIYPMAEATLHYFAWQMHITRNVMKYDHIVLFGAGNMCRNYMLWFGEAKKPLFTCDNNKKLWGTEFEGLIVHDPSDILDPECVPDPEHTGIFICNMYYREIKAQLDSMGVKNIEFFNDEFMPRSYMERFDSLKRGIAGR